MVLAALGIAQMFRGRLCAGNAPSIPGDGMDFVSATVPRAQPQIIKNIANRKVCSQHTAEALALLAPPASAHKQAHNIRGSPWSTFVRC